MSQKEQLNTPEYTASRQQLTASILKILIQKGEFYKSSDLYHHLSTNDDELDFLVGPERETVVYQWQQRKEIPREKDPDE